MHINQTGLTSLAGVFELRKCELSVVRSDYSSEDEVLSSVINPQLHRDSSRVFVGVLQAKCADIRSLSSDIALREICVVDDGQPHFTSHAQRGFSCDVASSTRSVQVAARANLTSLFEVDGILSLQGSALSDRD